jgi:hypothetical protein
VLFYGAAVDIAQKPSAEAAQDALYGGTGNDGVTPELKRDGISLSIFKTGKLEQLQQTSYLGLTS